MSAVASSAPAARPPKLEANPYPWYSPRFWHGMRPLAWWGMCARHGFRIHPIRWPMAFLIGLITPFNTVMGLVQSLVPDNIARNVLGYLTQFAAKASRLGVVGLVAFIVTALALIFTIDRTLNSIWRVRQLRPFAQRLLIYWGCGTAVRKGQPKVISISASGGKVEVSGSMQGRYAPDRDIESAS